MLVDTCSIFSVGLINTQSASFVKKLATIERENVKEISVLIVYFLSKLKYYLPVYHASLPHSKVKNRLSLVCVVWLLRIGNISAKKLVLGPTKINTEMH